MRLVYAVGFHDGSVEVVSCQQGLQFLPDTGAALREIRRVIVPGGRLACTVFSEVPAYYVALADALALHVGAEAATSCLSRYMLRDAKTIRALSDDPGFDAIKFTPTKTGRPGPMVCSSP
jgi:ubiquinone/menaquinone biosynthesis C-methylase UbiE